jgi:speckle-type POZ protein
VAGELFRAHRCVLAARSPVFQAELFGPVKEQATHTRPIRIDDMEPAIFQALLHFIYTDAISDNASGNVAMQHLLVAAERHGLDRLKAMCEDKLCHAIDVETVLGPAARRSYIFTGTGDARCAVTVHSEAKTR